MFMMNVSNVETLKPESKAALAEARAALRSDRQVMGPTGWGWGPVRELIRCVYYGTTPFARSLEP